MVRPATNNSGISPGLLFALLGSVLLHVGVLLWAPMLSPARVYAPHFIEARLVQASPPLAVPVTPAAAPTLPGAAISAAPQASAPPAPELPGPPAVVARPYMVTADPAYYSVEQVDESARLLGDIRRAYPLRARNAGVEGFVTLYLLINERGGVDEIHVVESQPTGYFEESAIAMLRGQRFTPAIKQGHAVKSRWQKTIRFKLQD